jgi:hypothetical protein
MGGSDILAKPLSPGSAWMGEILESLGVSNAEGERLHNVDIVNAVDYIDTIFDCDIDLQALANDDIDHIVSAFWDHSLGDGVDPFNDPI